MQYVGEKFKFNRKESDLTVVTQLEKCDGDPIRNRISLLSNDKILEYMPLVSKVQYRPIVWSGAKSDPIAINTATQCDITKYY